MFSFSYSTPHKIVGVINSDKPITSLGFHKDIKTGQVYDIHSARYQEGKNIVCACPVNQLNDYFTDTSNKDFGFVEQEWFPYEVKYEKDN